MQIRKGSKYLIFYVVLFVALPPFAIDAYIPAFSNLSNYFHVNQNQIAMTVSTYLFGFSLGMLIWGALSDKFGRKKILTIGMSIYTISTILCTYSYNFETLTFMRFLQGLGDSPAAVAAMAILKDCYRGQKLIKMMATMVMVFMIAPIIAPIIGSVIIYTTGEWQNIFHFLTFYGIVLLIITLLMPETHKTHKRSKSLLISFFVYIKHLMNTPYILATISGGLCFGALFSFIGASSNIMLGYLDLGYFQFCLLFALNIFGIVFSSLFIKNKVNNANQSQVIYYGYTIAISLVLLNTLCSYLIDNIYVFVIINTLATACFALVNIIITARAIDLLKEGFAAGNAIMRLIKFLVAGVATTIVGFFSINHLMVEIPIQQLFFLIVSLLIFITIKDKLKD
ncbi:multidrug effflux MFS transporter [Francisella adeliensis]|uniref:Bcr/CflA family efflux transporter n=1 Tax=Francisella adeliensis TaxID=2007306 RepID=A0A2Z4XZ77_9GAMM|nr:multidrug effflux MFS transporter [Francisella adeliensis]AXA33735.1 Bcr/CflA family drug resistance efflux transporter [Francisella adeliensis]MBK2085632.1 multidrug effflux MFS transporter [Francisella adeliensis]MBK2097510.1 multidrug effflux MFS transporter [Francisella adeliensis]QIW11970.1 multidrug effflux MFS transporter [Francisella adeliensis]QIW13846.1 multidrug effflux MFS transporter [Francisella adeliensis]